MTQEVLKCPEQLVEGVESTLTGLGTYYLVKSPEILPSKKHLTALEKDQLTSKMIQDEEGVLGICLNKDSSTNCWVHYWDSSFERWIPKRPALPMEVKRAQLRLQDLQEKAGEPTQGW